MLTCLNYQQWIYFHDWEWEWLSKWAVEKLHSLQQSKVRSDLCSWFLFMGNKKIRDKEKNLEQKSFKLIKIKFSKYPSDSHKNKDEKAHRYAVWGRERER